MQRVPVAVVKADDREIEKSKPLDSKQLAEPWRSQLLTYMEDIMGVKRFRKEPRGDRPGEKLAAAACKGLTTYLDKEFPTKEAREAKLDNVFEFVEQVGDYVARQYFSEMVATKAYKELTDDRLLAAYKFVRDLGEDVAREYFWIIGTTKKTEKLYSKRLFSSESEINYLSPQQAMEFFLETATGEKSKSLARGPRAVREELEDQGEEFEPEEMTHVKKPHLIAEEISSEVVNPCIDKKERNEKKGGKKTPFEEAISRLDIAPKQE